MANALPKYSNQTSSIVLDQAAAAAVPGTGVSTLSSAES
jgi:hypothetical protein